MDTVSAGEPTLVGAAWRYRLLVLVATFAFLGGGVIYAEARSAVYSATATMVLQDPHSDPVFASSTNQPPDRYAADQIAVLQSPQLAAAAAAVGAGKNPPLGLSADDFSTHTVVSGIPLNGNLVKISFTAGDSPTALAGVDALRTAYEQTVQDAVGAQLSSLLGQIDTEVTSINAQLAAVASQLAGTPPSNSQALAQQRGALVARRDTLSAKRDQIVVDASSGSNGVALYLPPQTTTHSSKLVAALPLLSLVAVLGLVMGVLAAYVLASRRRMFRGRGDPELVLGAPLVAEIPRFEPPHPLPAFDGEPAPAATAFRSAALVIQARPAIGSLKGTHSRRAQGGGRRLVLVSAARREGRSTVAANLGIALADSGLSTLLIDADPATRGLSQLLHGRLKLVASVDRVHVGLTAAGMPVKNVIRPGNSLARLALLRVGHVQRPLDDDRDRLLQQLESTFSVVIIDGPPLSDSGPYWPLVRRAESALVLVTDTTPVTQLEEVSRLLGAIEMPAFGYVYNHQPLLRRPTRPPEKKPAPPVSASASDPGLSASA